MTNVIAFPCTVRQRPRAQRDFLVLHEIENDWDAERRMAEQALLRDDGRCVECQAFIPHRPTARCTDCGGEA